MPRSLVVMAGQSNATALNGSNGGMAPDEAFAALTGSHGVVTRLVASNGAPLTFGRADPDWYNRGEMVASLVATIRAALDADPDLHLAGVVWVQGEADSHAAARAGEYGVRLAAMVDDVAAALTGYGERTADFRLSLLALSADCPVGATRSQWDTVRAQQLAIDHPRISVVDPDALQPATLSQNTSMFQSDGLHYQAGANATLLPALIRAFDLRVTGTSAADTLSGGAADDVMEGGSGADRLFGSTGADTLWGGQGSDVLQGGRGDDVLVGGGGIDTLEGGRGTDRFVFFVEALNPKGAVDQITDFQRGTDLIDLRTIDANPLQAGNQAFRFAAQPGQPGTVWLESGTGGTTVRYDIDGDGRADGGIFCARIATLDMTDFLL